MLRPSSFLNISPDEWHFVNSVNIDGVFHTMQLGCKYMVEQAESLKAKAQKAGANGQPQAQQASASSPQDDMETPNQGMGALSTADNDEPYYGRVITIASQAGRSISKLGGAHYTASKAAAIGELLCF